MKINKPGFVLLGLFLCICQIHAQDKSKYKFGEISAADFKLTEGKFDSGANAIIIKDIGDTHFEGNDDGFFTLVYTRYLRVKILNKNGFDAGNYQVDLYHDLQDREKVTFVKGSVFNLERGAISENKLDDKSIFSEKFDNHYDRVKFSMPALKEGSIYDLEYVIKSPFYGQLRAWNFQGEYPRLWSEYVVTFPPPFHYMVKQQGDDQFEVKTIKEVFQTFTIRQNTESSGKVDNSSYQKEQLRLKGTSLEQRWVKKNVPALREEPFTTTVKNYYSRVSFQLNYFQWKTMDWTGDRHDYLENWSSASKNLLEQEGFGQSLSHVNVWMNDELKNVTQGAGSQEEIARRVYEYVRNNFKDAGTESYIENYTYANNLREVFKKKQGSVTEINLILTSMLRHEGLHADPLILSTKKNGFASAVYPLLEEYNYVICVVYLGDKFITLDATQPFNDFGELPVKCFNGYGHVMNVEKPTAIRFSSDSLNEISNTSVFIINDEKGKPSGSLTSNFGKSGSYDRREEIANSSEKSFEKKIQTYNSTEMTIDNFRVDSLNQYKFPLSIQYDFELKNFVPGADIFYLNPMLNEGYKTNPFISMERQYPVEIPFKIDYTYLFNMEIPAGYQVDELPKSAKVAYNDNEGFFEYLVQKGESNIQMRVRLKLNKAFFPTEEYGSIRDFFAFIVKKENEQVVFKKIK